MIKAVIVRVLLFVAALTTAFNSVESSTGIGICVSFFRAVSRAVYNADIRVQCQKVDIFRLSSIRLHVVARK